MSESESESTEANWGERTVHRTEIRADSARIARELDEDGGVVEDLRLEAALEAARAGLMLLEAPGLDSVTTVHEASKITSKVGADQTYSYAFSAQVVDGGVVSLAELEARARAVCAPREQA